MVIEMGGYFADAIRAKDEYLEHGPWKKHKYIRKEGKKYIYESSKTDEETGITTDKYVAEDGSAIFRNSDFKYEPERPDYRKEIEDTVKDTLAKVTDKKDPDTGEMMKANYVDEKEEEKKKKFVVKHSDDSYLAHHGVLGQKWGVRRFQDKNGHITAEGKERYRRDKIGNNIGRALTNTSLGQRLAVNLNKGYREDKKEIKGLYKQKKAELGDDKEKQKSLKDDYKKTLGEARTTAAQVNYGWQSDDANKKIQTQSVGKAFVKSLLMGGTGTMLYDNVSADTGKKGAAAVIGILGGAADTYTGGAVAIGSYAYGKYKTGKAEKEQKNK